LAGNAYRGKVKPGKGKKGGEWQKKVKTKRA